MKNEELYYLPTSELLKHIQAEKEHLIKEKVIKKSKPLPPIAEEEIPYDLPVDWEWVRLGDIGDIFNGNSINAQVKKTHYEGLEFGYPYIGTKDVKDNEIVYNNGVKIPFETNFKIARKGATLVCSEGGSAGKKVGIINQDVCFGNKLFAIQQFKPILEDKFIYYFTLSSLFKNQFSSMLTGMIGGVSVNNFKKILIPLPPLYIQSKIVQKLEQLSETKDSLLSHAEYQLNYTKKMRETLLQEVIRGELVAQDENDEPASVLLEKIKTEKERLIKQKVIKKQKELPPITDEEKNYELPVNWEWVRLGEYIKDISGGSTPSKQNNLFWNGSIPWASVKDLKDYKYLENTIDRITEYALENTNIKLIPENQLIVCTRVGLGKVLINKIKTTINQDLKAISLINNCSIEYLYYAIKTLSIEGTGTTVKGITQEELLNKIIPIPPLAEQERIVTKLDELMLNCDQLEAKAEEMKNYTSKLFEASLKEAFMPE